MRSNEMNMLSDGAMTCSADAFECNLVEDEEEEEDAEYLDLRDEYMECESLKQSNGFNNIGNGASGIVSKVNRGALPLSILIHFDPF